MPRPRKKAPRAQHPKSPNDSGMPRPFQVAHLAAVLAISKDKHPTWRMRPDELIADEDYYQDLILRADYLLRCAEEQQWRVYASEYFDPYRSYSYAEMAKIFTDAGWHGLQSKNTVEKFFKDAKNAILQEVQQTKEEQFDLERARKVFAPNHLRRGDFVDVPIIKQNQWIREDWDQVHQGDINFAEEEERWVHQFLCKSGPFQAHYIFSHLEKLPTRCSSLNFSEKVIRIRGNLKKGPL
ncbi:MAG: hypothetical protein ACFUZC_18860 [Chthoniobacteraceae bacterium]